MSNEKFDRRLLRLALRIHSDVVTRSGESRSVKLPDQAWRDCQSLVSKLQRAQYRGLSHAADRLRTELLSQIRFLRQHLESVSKSLIDTHSPDFAKPVELYRDLLAIRDEFEGLDWDQKAKTLAVTTQRIVLDNVDLGPFEIRLHWDHLTWPEPYQTIALEPNRPLLNESVTHPHVQDDSLCEGEGRYSIERALQQGRLLDFFFLVRGVLTTYNVSNAYVSLERWNGVHCDDCDDVIPGEELRSCERCERHVCDDCSSGCAVCDQSFCDRCMTRCPECGDGVCSGCLSKCCDCGKSICASCSNNKRCGECHEESTCETIERPDGAANAPLQPLGVGEADVPA